MRFHVDHSEGGVSADTHPEWVSRVTSALVTIYNEMFCITAPFRAPSPLLATRKLRFVCADVFRHALVRVSNSMINVTTAQSFK